MQQVPIIERYMKMYNIEDSDVSLDYGGLGQGVGDRLVELDYQVNTVMFGGGAPKALPHENTQNCKNMRAYMYYNLFCWLRDGGKIVKDDGFRELSVVNYKTDSERKFQIQPKDELKRLMRELGIRVTSPDVADSACLTFAEGQMLEDDDIDII